MTEPKADEEKLTPDDEAFVRRVAEEYAAPPMPASRRVAFTAELERRVSRRHQPRWRAVFATLAVAGVVIAILSTQSRTPERVATVGVPPSTQTALNEATSADTPEQVLLAMTEPAGDGDEELPAEYQAIEGVFLDGGGDAGETS